MKNNYTSNVYSGNIGMCYTGKLELYVMLGVLSTIPRNSIIVKRSLDIYYGFRTYDKFFPDAFCK